jgi:hypothetical protein
MDQAPSPSDLIGAVRPRGPPRAPVEGLRPHPPLPPQRLQVAPGGNPGKAEAHRHLFRCQGSSFCQIGQDPLRGIGVQAFGAPVK